jgi:4a-hydroxytetrahydrobiopterin dehydratase
MKLRDGHAKAGRLPLLTDPQLAELLPQIPDWSRLIEGGAPKLSMEVVFADFKAAMAFLNRLAELAEAENHHPDFAVHYNRVRLTLWTHVSGGLTENDLILAAKIDGLLKP